MVPLLLIYRVHLFLNPWDDDISEQYYLSTSSITSTATLCCHYRDYTFPCPLRLWYGLSMFLCFDSF